MSLFQIVPSSSPYTRPVAVRPAGGVVSIVEVAISNGPVHAHSNIQPEPNQQSVVEAPDGATLQSVFRCVTVKCFFM